MWAWLAENWVAFGTLAAVSIGAAASIWTARETRRLAILQQRAAAQPEPDVEISYSAYDTRPEVSKLEISIRNRADIGVDLVSVFSPATRRYRLHPRVFTADRREHGETGKHADIAQWPRRVEAPFKIGRAGTKQDILILTVSAHLKPLLGLRQPPVICLEMRWRNSAVTTFIMQVTATPKSTK
jgi:hypothetical protein